MAKQTSKYFTSVISRLIESRRNETIEIDQNFKQQLREGLMARAELMEKPETGGGAKEYLTKWRYAFALVPSALLLTIVAAHMMNLPVEIDSDVVVPMASTSETTESSPDGGGFTSDSGVYDADAGKVSVFEDLDDVNVGKVEVDILESPKKIKTFPGATVMPENYLIIDTAGNKSPATVSPAKVTSGEVSGSGSEQVTTEELAENFNGDYQPQGSYRYELVEDIFIDRDGDTRVGDDKGKDIVESHKEIKSSVDGDDGDDFDEDDGGDGLNVVNGGGSGLNVGSDGGGSGLSAEPGGGSGDNGSGLSAGDGDGSSSDNGSGLPEGDGGSDDRGQQDGDDDQGLVPYAGSGNLNVNQTFVDVTDANVTNGAGGVNKYSISYYANLSAAEKADLESRHIASLTNGRDVNSVVVSEANGVITVEVYFVDGTKKLKTFARQVTGSGIDAVRVVNTQTVQQTTGLQYRSFNIDYTQRCLSRGSCVAK